MSLKKQLIIILILIISISLMLELCNSTTELENSTTELENSTTEPGYYVASSESDVFHRPDCRYVDQIKPENKITFSTRQEAINAGYRPCKVCKP